MRNLVLILFLFCCGESNNNIIDYERKSNDYSQQFEDIFKLADKADDKTQYLLELNNIRAKFKAEQKPSDECEEIVYQDYINYFNLKIEILQTVDIEKQIDLMVKPCIPWRGLEIRVGSLNCKDIKPKCLI